MLHSSMRRRALFLPLGSVAQLPGYANSGLCTIIELGGKPRYPMHHIEASSRIFEIKPPAIRMVR